jgi:hypothetical protein
MAVAGVGIVAVGAAAWAQSREFDLADHELAYRSTAEGASYGHLVTPEGPTKLECARVFATATEAICLRHDPDAPESYQVATFDAKLAQTRGLPLNGLPSRTAVSGDGKRVAWTVFVSGDSYNKGKASTRAGILDTTTGDVVPTLENFSITLEGLPYQSIDVNFWGITFVDDNVFYATLSTHGRRFLVKGDLASRTIESLRDNVECPSLSPDKTRIAFKKRVSADIDHPWRFFVLDLATMKETALAETRSVDDQAAWLDDSTVMYGVRRDDRHSDVWATPADGSGEPRILIHDAESPAAIR